MNIKTLRYRYVFSIIFLVTSLFLGAVTAHAYPGCTDPWASNYNWDADSDDGSCSYPVSGCTDPWANNYNPSANMDDGSCVYDISGCTDYTACNYNAEATVDDGSCESESCIEWTCINGAINPPQCNQCDSGMAFSDGNPPACVAYCNDNDACNYGAEATCDYDCNPTYCCAVDDALNFDPSCPDNQSNPKKVDRSSACTYCDSTSTDPACKTYYCSSELPSGVGAVNGETNADCQATNPDLNCESDNTMCQFTPAQYCADESANNDEAQSDCEARVNNQNIQCVADSSICTYDDTKFCDADNPGTVGALNRQSNFECTANLSGNGGQCVADTGSCIYENYYCEYAFAADITCPSGFHFTTPPNEYYYYSYLLGANDSCVALTSEQLNYLKTYLSNNICVSDNTPVCTEGYCSYIDWCPNVEGPPTDPTQCVDACPLDPGVQSNESQCNALVNGVCGSSHNGTDSSASNITGSKACSVGSSSAVSTNGSHFNWSCAGTGGGTSPSCSASLSCADVPNTYYCDLTKQCTPNGTPCHPPNDCVNPNLCVFKGSVSLSNKLSVTPIVNKGGVCTVDLGNTSSSVFESFAVGTQCRLYNQDGLLTSIAPQDLLSDSEFNYENIQKDMTYTLKCFDGTETAATTYTTATGACRLNANQQEVN